MQLTRVSTAYVEAGLPHIWLHGAQARRCTRCDQTRLALANRSDLHRAIAARLVVKPFPLAPEEVRFLRSHLGCANDQLARCLGVSPETASRWASITAHARINPTADRLLRLIVAMRGGIDCDAIDVCTSIAESPLAEPIALREVEGRWVEAR